MYIVIYIPYSMVSFYSFCSFLLVGWHVLLVGWHVLLVSVVTAVTYLTNIQSCDYFGTLVRNRVLASLGSNCCEIYSFSLHQYNINLVAE